MNLIIFMLGIVLLMIGIFKGKNIVIIVPIVLIAIIVLTGDITRLPSYSKTYITAMIDFSISNALIFYLGVLFGAYISATGLSRSMAQIMIQLLGEKRVILSLILLVNVMMLGGISGFIIIFTIYPIAHQVFTQLHIPKRFIFGLIGVGMATYLIGSMPGALQIQNIIPTMFLESNLFSGYKIGIVLTIYLFVTGYLYLNTRIKHAMKKEISKETVIETLEPNINKWLVFMPLLIVFVANLLFTLFLFPQFELSNHQRIVYALNSSLVLGVISTFIITNVKVNHKHILRSSMMIALKPLLFVGTTVGFGTVISLMPLVQDFKAPLIALNPLYGLPLTVAIFAAISGSATGGLSITFPFLGPDLLMQAEAFGLSHDTLHRLAVMSSVTLDTLPTNGTTMTMLKVTGLTYKSIYLDYFILTVLNTTIATLIGILLISSGFM
ncbi:MAG: GntP family permease [Candidatus Izemoplasmataceae bacterium]